MIAYRFAQPLFLCVAIVAALPAKAQTSQAQQEPPEQAGQNRADPPARPSGDAGVFSLVVENDLLYNVDRHYTNGIRASYLTPRGDEPVRARDLATSLPIFTADTDLRVEYALGQSMFTPSDIKVSNPPLDDRPYGGWLYGSLGLIGRTDHVLDQVIVSLGVVGPASLAEQSQKFVHSIIGSPEPQGWDSQLKNEPAVQMFYERSWRSPAFHLPAGVDLDATPHAGGALGNVFTYGNMGMMFRLGQNLPLDYGVQRIFPSLPGSGYFEPVNDVGWYFFAGVDGRAVARNIFLDGNTFADSRSVDKRTYVGDAQFGIAVIVKGVRIAYTHVLRTKEFETQDSADRFGALSVSFRF
ncbi:MAG TPA: lipid A deacylase LpxR family protein [Ferrovibrio sp.]|uniref:lipid A deacylase LpxR family protein n=1 Tax=Ferrovibrio sp. TaxID=1917215 RepID=UPI002ED00B9C